jgi:hypothetical protein
MNYDNNSWTKAYWPGYIKNKPRTFRGRWWINDKKEVIRAGELIIKRGYNPYLEVEHWETTVNIFKHVPVPIIHGESLEGIPFSLFECEHLGTETFNTRVGRSRYVPKIIIWGLHVESLTEKLFDRLHLSCKQVLEIGHIGRRLDHGSDESGADRITIQPARPILPTIDCGSHGSLDIVQLWEMGGLVDETRIWPNATLTFHGAEKYSFNDTFNILYRCQLSIGFTCHKVAKFPLIELWRNGHELPCGILTNNHLKTIKDADFRFYCPRMPHSESQLSTAYSGIFKSDQKILSTIQQFQNALFNTNQVMDYRFFDMARVFERVLDGDLLCPNGQHKSIVRDIYGKLDISLNEVYRLRIKESLSHANEPSFRSKVEKFIKEDNQANDLCPAPEMQYGFIDRIMRGRNNFAHFASEKKPEITWDDLERLVRLIDLKFWRLFGSNEIILWERYGQWASRLEMDKLREKEAKKLTLGDKPAEGIKL